MTVTAFPGGLAHLDHRRCLLASVTVMSLGVLAPSAAGAQAIDRLPSSAEPGRAAPSLPEIPTLGAGDFIETIQVPRGSEPPPVAEQINVNIDQIIVEGAAAFPEDALTAATAPFIGPDGPLARVFAAAGAIGQLYRDAGFILSFAFVPEQEVEDGVYRITVVEGRIDQIIVQGFDDALATVVRAIAAPIAEDSPLTQATLERHLLLINDIDGVTAGSTIRPSSTVSGASDLIIDGALGEHFALSALANNRGSKFVGPISALASVSLYNLLKHGDTVSLTASVTGDFEEQRFVSGAYSRPFGVRADGLLAHFDFSYAQTRPGDSLDVFDITSTATSFGLGATYPVLRSRAQNLTIGAFVEARSSKVEPGDSAFSALETEDRVREARLEIDYDLTDGWSGVTLLGLTMEQGLPIFGATDGGEGRSRADGSRSFTKFTASATRVQFLPFDLSALVDVSAQYSLDPLLSSEEYGAGGARFGRAFDAATLSGEHGVGVSLELRYDAPSPFPSVLDSLQIYGFWDYAQVWDMNNATAANTALSSAGAGLRFGLYETVSAQFEYARPIATRPDDIADDQDSARYLFSIAFQN